MALGDEGPAQALSLETRTKFWKASREMVATRAPVPAATSPHTREATFTSHVAASEMKNALCLLSVAWKMQNKNNHEGD